MIKDYPELTVPILQMREILHRLFQKLPDGISEFTFANIYLFRDRHKYQIAKLPDDLFVITGREQDKPFFMLPFGLPEKDTLDRLFGDMFELKGLSENQAKKLAEMGYSITEDRDSFDYLYLRRELAELTGRKFHKKKNLVNTFIQNHRYVGRPLLAEYTEEALDILETWRTQRQEPGDYDAAKEALEQMEYLQLCGGIYYVNDEPIAYSLGEELACGESFVIHFEKAIKAGQYRGIYQFVNQAFTAILPDKYVTVNREQDLGEPGLRQAKESYRPVGFVKKYSARADSGQQ